MRASNGDRPHVLVHVDELRRDFFVSAALKDVLESRGARVTLTNRSRLRWYLQYGDFDAVLVSQVQMIPFELLHRLAERTDIHMLTTEGALTDEKGVLRTFAKSLEPSRQRAYIDATARFHLWGDFSRRCLIASGLFNERQLPVCGAPRFDYHRESSRLPSPTSLDLPIGLVCRFVFLHPYRMIANPIRTIDRLRADRYRGSLFPMDKEPEDVYWIQAAAVRVLLELLDECQRRGQRVLLRPHPREDLDKHGYLLEKYDDIISWDHKDLSFECWLEKVSAVASFNSTSNYEVVASGRLGISLDALLGDRGIDHTGLSANTMYPVTRSLVQPRTFDDLFAAIDRLRSGEWSAEEQYREPLENVRDICGFPRTQPALSNVADQVFEALRESADRRRGRRLQSVRNGLCRMLVRLVEFVLFAILRRGVVSVYYPMWERWYRRRWGGYIEKYTQ